jgi:phosphoglycerate kinase
MEQLPSIRDHNLQNKYVFIRSEFNVPVDANLKVVDESRIVAGAKTIRYASERGAKILVGSHRGRPWGAIKSEFSLRCLVDSLSRHIGRNVKFAPDCIGPSRTELQKSLAEGDVLLLENIRFYAEENANSPEFARSLLEGVDIYVNDAFGNCHRAHASMVEAARQSPVACFGFLVERELRALHSILDDPRKPLVLAIGGAKVAGKDGKIHVISNFLRTARFILTGGRLGAYFLAAKGLDVGATLQDKAGIDKPGASVEEEVAAAKQVLREAERYGCEILTPSDAVLGSRVAAEEHEVKVTEVTDIPRELFMYDIGPRTRDDYGLLIAEAGTVVWNGPMGVVENPVFSRGSESIAKAMASTKAVTLIGGGDSIKVISALHLEASLTHISTGGGAMLTFLMGRSLPAIAAVLKR